MAPIQVSVKHAGKIYSNIELDPDLPGAAFKRTVYETTGVPPDRAKIMVKGGVLKDDTDWKQIGVRAGHTFMVIGAAGVLPRPPSEPVLFLEDMLDEDLADALRIPVGLQNLGNTCYANSTIQCLRAIPELQISLKSFNTANTDPNSQLTLAIRDLYGDMNRRTDSFSPLLFLQSLRQVFPQFAETVRGAYAQQDAEECWAQIMNSLSSTLYSPTPREEPTASKLFVEQYMMGEMTKELRCDEAPDEPVTILKERILKIECNISINTNYMYTGIQDALDTKVEKNSPSLGHMAVYTQKSRISRLPSNLTVHMVRFYWRRDINKKAKILRKVKFPLELDMLDLVTDDLKKKLSPVNAKLKEISRERQERQKIRRRMKPGISSTTTRPASGVTTLSSVSPTILPTMEGAVTTFSDPRFIGETAQGEEIVVEELDAESVYRAREAEDLAALVDADIKKDIGANMSGLYELCGIITHKGASADSGHYIGFVKRDSFNWQNGEEGNGEEWVKFDDDKVSIITREKILTLEGGGEDSAAYILLYRGVLSNTCH